MKQPSPLIVVVGPTASGKSALAMRIAERFGGEIIAADSRTIYRGLDIGTAKPTTEDQRKVPHHLLDVCEPDEQFTAAQFKELANHAIEQIHARGHVPILVGGTGLYVDSILFDYQFGMPADPLRRAELQELSVEQLQQICRDKNITLPINSMNKRHLIRSIELGGVLRDEKRLRSNTFVVGISTTRETLRERIRARATKMLQRGVLEEAARVGVHYGWKGEALKGNVYPILRQVLEGKKSLDDTLEEITASDMSLAKRQMTWFRRNPHIMWSDDPDELLRAVGTFVRQQKD